MEGELAYCRYPKLEEPIEICGKLLKNRIVVPPMADFGATKEDGLINSRHIQHYCSLAEGGAGLIIIEACAVSKMHEPRHTLRLYEDNCIWGLHQLAEAMKHNDTVILVQLINTGLAIMPENDLSEISKERLMYFQEDFITAAVRCQKAGFDGVELHAAHGFFLNEIIERNNRDDEYGGCFDGRFRFIKDVISGIKAVCGTKFIVSVRFGNAYLDELKKEAAAIENSGADLLDVSYGCKAPFGLPKEFPYDNKIYMASLVKEISHVPVIAVGGIRSGEQAEQIIKCGYADMVAVGTGHLCDPKWTKKSFLDKKLLCVKTVSNVCGI